MSWRDRSTVSAILFAGSVAVAVAGPVTAERVYTPERILERWEAQSFSGETRYRLQSKLGRPAVHAGCAPGNASGLLFRGEIDLRRTPILEWRWYAPAADGGPPETAQAGDDFTARVYVVDEHGLLQWRTRALNYVWSTAQPVGADWPNPFAEQAHMIVVQSGAGADGWVTERRNIREDFRRYHDREVTRVDALAIMTDCDNAGHAREGWYGEIRLLSE